LKTIMCVLFFGVFPFCSVVILLLVCYANPDAWYSELLAFTIPPVMIFSAVMLLFYLRLKPGRVYLFFLLTAAFLCMKPLFKTIAFSFKKDKSNSDFSVMSYN